MAWSTRLTRVSFEAARPSALIPIFFSERPDHLWAEDNYAAIRLFFGTNSEKIVSIQITLPNSADIEIQRPILMAFFKVVAPEEPLKDLVDWVFGNLNRSGVFDKETAEATVTLLVASQEVTLLAKSNSKLADEVDSIDAVPND
jgi:hypothetical protein